MGCTLGHTYGDYYDITKPKYIKDQSLTGVFTSMMTAGWVGGGDVYVQYAKRKCKRCDKIIEYKRKLNAGAHIPTGEKWKKIES